MIPLSECDGPSAMAVPLKRVIEDLEATVSAVREMTKRLCPLVVDDLGIVPAIQWLCRSLSQATPDIRIRTRIQVVESDIPGWLKADIFHVLERIVSPAVARGRLSRIKISLRSGDGSVKLKMLGHAKNNSPQNPLEDGSERGMDFIAVRSRVEARGGSARWSSRFGLVDVVAVVWPLQGV
jgi:two-component system NarL family sensor kinase